MSTRDTSKLLRLTPEGNTARASTVAPARRALPTGNTSLAASSQWKFRRGPRSGSAKLVEKVADETAASFARPEALTGVGAFDPRWVLAVRTNYLLEGGRAALLTPESRRYVLDLAKTLGLRAFDANLIIAIVQDSARTTGEGLTDDARARLGMVRDPATNRDRTNWIGFGLGVVMAAGVLAWAISRWFVSVPA